MLRRIPNWYSQPRLLPAYVLAAFAFVLGSCASKQAWTADAHAAIAALPSPASPVQIAEDKAQQIVFVDNHSPTASDKNPGTEQLPLKTLSRAAEMAQASNDKRIGVHVYIKPGIYREQVSLKQSGNDTGAPIIFEGTAKGEVVLAGSDVWSNWQKIGDNLYQHAWPYRWGLAPYPAGWQSEQLADIVRRREMIFVNGHPLVQALAYSDLTDYSFYADEGNQTIYVRTGPGLPLDDRATVEVAIRPRILIIEGKQNVVLRDLVFRHGNAAVQDAAVQISDSTNVLIEGCRFVWNNWVGLGFSGVTNLTMYNNAGDWNGGEGFDGYNLLNLYMDGNSTSFNNWRGARGNFYGWSVTGAKVTGVHTGSIRNHVSVGNRARGLWIDFDNTNITISGATLAWNFNDGIFIEANAGPVLISGSTISGNRNAGVAGGNSADVTLTNNSISGNTMGQIVITGDYDRTVKNWETNVEQNVRAERWTVRSNTISSTDSSQPVFQTPNWQPFLTSLSADYNVWSKPGDPRAFHIETNWLTFDEWQSLVHTDLTSTFR